MMPWITWLHTAVVPPGTPVSSTRKLISSSSQPGSYHRLDMTLAVAEALTPNTPINQIGGFLRVLPFPPPMKLTFPSPLDITFIRLQSSLLMAILGELPLLEGVRRLSGSVAYVPQESWIMSDTIRANILLGSAMDTDKYDDVINACALNVVDCSVSCPLHMIKLFFEK